jgi:hypothetical protein
MSLSLLSNKNVSNNLGLSTLDQLSVSYKVTIASADWTTAAVENSLTRTLTPTQSSAITNITADSLVSVVSTGANSAQAALNWLITVVPGDKTLILYVASNGNAKPAGDLSFIYTIHNYAPVVPVPPALPATLFDTAELENALVSQ